jgi:hypothetical protein
MKKNVLALSITAAVVGLGFAGGAQAMTGTLQGAAVGSTLSLNQDGVGHMLLVPYYSAQAENSTLINLVNTDTINGKAVKVRFRGAANSDDVFDFQVFLSPGDVFAFNVSKNSAGLAQLTTNDNSCTKPNKATLNATPFLTARLDKTLGAADAANGTREGYVEIFNMADIPKASLAAGGAGPDVPAVGSVSGDNVNDLFFAIKHANKVAPCTGTAWSALDSTNLSFADSRSAGLLPPTTGLMANSIIINVVGAAAWSASATAIQSVTPAVAPSVNAVPSTGNVVYWPQTSNAVGAVVNEYTADPLLRTSNVFNAAGAADVTPAVVAAFYDLPDMSTPYSATANVAADGVRALRQAADLTQAIATTSVANEFLTDSTISAATDWTFSMPTRRYSISLDYNAINTTPGLLDDGRRFSDIFATATTDTNGTGTQAYFNAANTLVTSRQICVRNVVPTAWDREETTIGSTGVVVSPSTPADPLTFCGEASVLSFNRGGISANGTGALKAQVSVKDLDATFVDGWMRITTPSATPITGVTVAGNVSGLPILGSSYNRASAGGVQTFGSSHAHRFGR